MIVAGYLVICSILGFFVPVKIRRLYILILSFMLPLLYFGFSVPNDSYDLSRYYVMIEHMQGMQLHDLFNTESTWSSYISGTEYVSFLYLWVIANVGNGIKELLPYVSGVIVYISLFFLAYRAAKKYPLSTQKFAIVILYIIFVFNYGEISGVRNAIAFAIAALVLYEDLVEHKNKWLSITLLVLLSMVHSSVFIILFLRIILLFRRMISFKLVAVACLLLQPGLRLIQMILSRFSGFSFIVTLLNKIKGYSIRTEYNLRLVFGGVIIAILVLIVATYVVKCEKAIFKSYYELTVCLEAIALGGIGIDVLFSRLTNLLFFISIPYMVYIAHTMIKNRLLLISIKNNRSKLLGSFSVIGLYVVSAFFIAFNTYYLYMRISNYFFV